MSLITVSVFMLTYNQESFIAQAIEGVLMQNTSFNYQLVIGEDCSTDKTRSICEKYANQFPDKIKLLSSLNNNIGLITNYMRTIKECDGKYISICDGDDYWIDELKLQKQVDFLEKNAEYSIVYTSVKLQFKNGVIKNWTSFNEKKYSDYEHLVFKNHIPSVSVLFKNEQKDNNNLPDWILKYPFGDWPTYLWTIKNGGKIHYLSDFTAVYRIDTGISSEIRKVNSEVLKINMSILKDIILDEDFISKRQVTFKAMIELKKNLTSSYNIEHQYFNGFVQFFKNLKYNGLKYLDTKMYFYSIIKSIK